MKIVFTGGGTGGHFYPIIAVAEQIQELVQENKLVEPRLYYLAPTPYNPRLLFENNIKFEHISAGKVRRYFSLKNGWDMWKTAWGTLTALWKLYRIYPDIIFSKGAYASFPVLLAGKILKIPVVIHESDSRPGRVNAWSGKFAKRVALSYPDALTFFPSGRAAVTGNPIRRDIAHPTANGAHEYFHFTPDLPVLLVVGGSQGAGAINDTLVDILPALVEKYQIIHQVGEQNIAEIEKRASTVLAGNEHATRYKPLAYLDSTAIRLAAGIASVVISRAGSTIFEIALWGIPSIIIPIPEEISHDQRHNAFAYARSGGAVVIEQANLTASVLLSEINRLIDNPALRTKMSEAAKAFAKPDAARVIANEILALGLEHES